MMAFIHVGPVVVVVVVVNLRCTVGFNGQNVSQCKQILTVFLKHIKYHMSCAG